MASADKFYTVFLQPEIHVPFATIGRLAFMQTGRV